MNLSRKEIDMIIHRYKDGSEGYEYEIGDEVEITGVIPWGEFFQWAIGRTGQIVKLAKGPNGGGREWQIDSLYVRHSPNWGPSHCMPWRVKPTETTYNAASVVDV
jgi:hypothetical protein